MTLKISDSLSLPLDTITDTLGIVAVKGAGKSYTFMKLFEQFVKNQLPGAIFDPVGVCYGLRSSADGSGQGLPVVIVGGQHGDVPLEEGAGAVLADWLLDERRPAVFDLSELPTKASMLRFCLDFFTRIYSAAATKREPIHIVLDEADEFAPQKPFGEEARLLRAVQVLVRRGRARGIGVTMVTQRPAVLSKDILTQVSTLIVGRIGGPQDRKAIEAWVDTHATAEQKKVFLASLASLPNREKWIWSPTRDVFARVTIAPRETFDSSATPKIGEVRVVPKALAPVDLVALRGRIADTIEKAKADDPKALRARIAELERQANAAKVWTEPQRVYLRCLSDDDTAALGTAVQAAEATAQAARSAAEAAHNVASKLLHIAQGLTWPHPPPGEPLLDRDAAAPPTVSAAPAPAPKASAARPPLIVSPPTALQMVRDQVAAERNGAAKLRAGERRMLEVLSRHHPTKLTRAQLGTLVGIAGAGTTFGTYIGVLKRHALVDVAGELVGLTREGLKVTGRKREPMTRKEILAIWMEKLRAGERKMLDAVVTEGELSREELGQIAGIDAAGTTFGTYLGVLKRNDLIVVAGSRVRLGTALAEASR